MGEANLLAALLAAAVGASAGPPVANGPLRAADGFRGIWYANQPSGDRYRYKYAGGMATFPQQHLPIAVYASRVHKTFFVYGGRPRERNRLHHMIAWYDHATGRVSRPRILLDKRTSDAHDNPTLCIDGEGYLWVFSNAHGTSRPAYIHRSRRPYAIDAFDLVVTTNFSYAQPWYLPDRGFLVLHTHYEGGRRYLYAWRSRDGRRWDAPRPLARAAEGHYQISWRCGERIGTAFNVHPAGEGLNGRTNLYYMETRDGGATWRNAAGEVLRLPVTEVGNPALALEYASKARLVYLKDLNFTLDGRPVILYLTSGGYASGPRNGPRTFTTARWTGARWEVREVTRGDNNYDFASLFIEKDGTWRIIGTTEPGPQPYGTGGEVAMWISRDRGATWTKARQLTAGSRWNHTYPRRPLDAHPDFYALWADGDARGPSESRLYFTDREGKAVWRLPVRMEGETARPEATR